jgi:hypothetical protein
MTASCSSFVTACGRKAKGNIKFCSTGHVCTRHSEEHRGSADEAQRGQGSASLGPSSLDAVSRVLGAIRKTQYNNKLSNVSLFWSYVDSILIMLMYFTGGHMLLVSTPSCGVGIEYSWGLRCKAILQIIKQWMFCANIVPIICLLFVKMCVVTLPFMKSFVLFLLIMLYTL